jgi:hypothetical protein
MFSSLGYSCHFLAPYLLITRMKINPYPTIKPLQEFPISHEKKSTFLTRPPKMPQATLCCFLSYCTLGTACNSRSDMVFDVCVLSRYENQSGSILAFQNRTFINMWFQAQAFFSVTKVKASHFSYQASIESASSSAVWLQISGLVCLASDRKSEREHYFLYSRARRVSGPKHSQIWIKRNGLTQ